MREDRRRKRGWGQRSCRRRELEEGVAEKEEEAQEEEEDKEEGGVEEEGCRATLSFQFVYVCVHVVNLCFNITGLAYIFSGQIKWAFPKLWWCKTKYERMLWLYLVEEGGHQEDGRLSHELVDPLSQHRLIEVSKKKQKTHTQTTDENLSTRVE